MRYIYVSNHNVTERTAMCLYFRFVVVNAGITYLYFSNFQQIDEEEYGGIWELTKEGFMTSFAGFLVSATGSVSPDKSSFSLSFSLTLPSCILLLLFVNR